MNELNRALQKYRSQNDLNQRLRALIERGGPEASSQIETLLREGADPNQVAKSTDSLICAILYTWPPEHHAAGVELLTRYGASVNLPDEMGETPLSIALGGGNYPPELPEVLLAAGAVPITQSGEAFKNRLKPCREGSANPERVRGAYYTFMVATGMTAGRVGRKPMTNPLNLDMTQDTEQLLEEVRAKIKAGELFPEAGAGYFNQVTFGTPKWCAHRFGSTYHPLEDGSLLRIGGEHEDFYDPNFYIYNDVIRVNPDGSVDVFLYPRSIFAPTDFHTSTRIGNGIFIIGGLGYQSQRTTGETNVHLLDLDDYSIRKLDTSGENPGWIHEHTTLADRENGCLYVFGGKIYTDGELLPNTDCFRFDPAGRAWERVAYEGELPHNGPVD